MLGGDGKIGLIVFHYVFDLDLSSRGNLLFRGVEFILVLLHEKVLGVLVPGSKVVFIEHDQIPFGQMHPFVSRLDTIGALITTHEILEATKANDGPISIRVLEL